MAEFYQGRKLPKGWMPVVDAAAELGVSRQRVHQLVVDGEMPGMMLGRYVLVPVKAVFQRSANPPKIGRPKMPKMPGWLPLTDAAEMMGVAANKVRYAARHGNIEALKMANGAWMISEAAAKAWTPVKPGPRRRTTRT